MSRRTEKAASAPPATAFVADAREAGAIAGFAAHVAVLAGRPESVVVAGAVALVWAFSGPIFGFSDIRPPAIDVGTAIVALLTVVVLRTALDRDGTIGLERRGGRRDRSEGAA